jgi:hypothetical protein
MIRKASTITNERMKLTAKITLNSKLLRFGAINELS